MNYSYQLRGTNGSGKTFVAQYLLNASEAKPILYSGKKVRAYRGTLGNIPLYILGSYETACGGCDTIPSVAETSDLLRMLMLDCDDPECFLEHHSEHQPCVVFFEGLMISHMLGTVGAMQAKLGKGRNVLAFLDTPLDKCIERVMTRRMLRKDERPFDPKNVVKDHPRVHQSKINAQKQGFKTVEVQWQEACVQVRQHIEQLYRGEL